MRASWNVTSVRAGSERIEGRARPCQVAYPKYRKYSVGHEERKRMKGSSYETARLLSKIFMKVFKHSFLCLTHHGLGTNIYDW